MFFDLQKWVKKVTKGVFAKRPHPLVLVKETPKASEISLLVASELTALGADVVALCRKEEKNLLDLTQFDGVFCSVLNGKYYDLTFKDKTKSEERRFPINKQKE